ncbi:uncharacterized protein LOC136760554 [Amia ocellicauda]|uniref:uncharacterized protein LOC136760554 n=1 Tax=Amia ocellicauda TaxID=2972642 RepID=UPI003464DA49
MDYSRASMYEERPPLIDCKICEVKVQGETNYKIHVTTPQHYKKEDALVACGKIRRRFSAPKWRDLMEYLDYLKLDEPIIGVHHVVEVDPKQPGNPLKYLCRLCFFEEEMSGVALHLVSRKHRQKYLETHRPDLVTWDENNTAQLGKVLRAKAEIVERQEGRGVIERSKKVLDTKQKDRPSFLKLAVQSLAREEARNRQPHGSDLDRFSSDADLSRPYYKVDLDKLSPEDAGKRQNWEEGLNSRSRMDERGSRYSAQDTDRFSLEHDSRRYRDEFNRDPYEKDRSRPYHDDDRRRRHHDDDLERRYPENSYSLKQAGEPERKLSRGASPTFYGDGRDRRYHGDAGERYFNSESTKCYPNQETMGMEDSYGEPSHSSNYGRDAVEKRQYEEFPGDGEGGTGKRQMLVSHSGRSLNLGRNQNEDTSRRLHLEGELGRGRVQDDGLERRHTPEVRSRRYGNYSLQHDSGRRSTEGDSARKLPEAFKRYLSEEPGVKEMRTGVRGYSEKYPEGGHSNRFTTERSTGGYPVEDQLERNMDEYPSKRPRLDPMVQKDAYQESHRPSTNPKLGQRDILDTLKSIEIESIEDAAFIKDKLCDLLKEFQANKHKGGPTASANPVISKDYKHMSMGPDVPQRDHYEDQGTAVRGSVEALQWSDSQSYKQSTSLGRSSYPEKPHYAQEPQRHTRRLSTESPFYPSSSSYSDASFSGEARSWAEDSRPKDLPHGKQSSLQKITSTLLELVSRRGKM